MKETKFVGGTSNTTPFNIVFTFSFPVKYLLAIIPSSGTLTGDGYSKIESTTISGNTVTFSVSYTSQQTLEYGFIATAASN